MLLDHALKTGDSFKGSKPVNITVQVVLEAEVRTLASVPLKHLKNEALTRKDSSFKTPVKKSTYQYLSALLWIGKSGSSCVDS